MLNTLTMYPGSIMVFLEVPWSNMQIQWHTVLNFCTKKSTVLSTSTYLY